MIITIIFACLIAALITTLILNVKYNRYWAETASFVLGALSLTGLFVVMMCLICGYSGQYDEKARDQRELIEYRLKYEEEYNPDTVAKINSYNSYIEYGNNYFCRFTLKDNSIYLIDVNVYLNKFKK